MSFLILNDSLARQAANQRDEPYLAEFFEVMAVAVATDPDQALVAAFRPHRCDHDAAVTQLRDRVAAAIRVPLR